MKNFYLAILPLFFIVLASAQHSQLAPMKSFLFSENNPQLENTSQPDNVIQTRSSVTHTISSGSYYYYPSSLTIEVGDSVVWINDGGYHDVNGDIETTTGNPYNNPETFDSEPTSVTGAVIYAHKFTIPGIYNYDCSVGQHAANGMVGSITVNSVASSAIWSDDFSVASKWTIANSTDDNQDWVITNVSDAGVGYGTGTWEDADFVTSASNNYALFDSDIVGGSGGFQDATITYNETLNLSSYPNVLLEFNNRGRMWQTTQNFVEVSNDGGASWIAYEVNAEETTSQLFENVKTVNITPTAGGQASINIRFRYVGSWDYAWMVDEPRIVEGENHDIIAQSAWIFEENSGGVEFGRTPISQVGNSFEIGGSVFNFGASDQTNVTLDVNFTGPTTITDSDGIDLLESDSTHTYSIISSLDLEVGLYEGIYTYTSDDEQGGDNFANNILKRNFEITNNIYSLDGIGIHPEEDLTVTSLGTASFQDAADAFFCATMYSFNNNDTISSITALLGTTSANAEIIAYVIDSINFFDGNFGEAISMSDLYVVTEEDVANGFVQIPVLGNANDGTLESLPINPGKYYVALELFSAGNTYDIRILDDETVGQPWDYSMIYIAGAQAYSNGNAFAIRLNMGSIETPCDDFELSINATDAACGLSNGSIEANVIGGVEPYNYDWSNGQSSSTASNLDSGYYELLVSDANNCNLSESISLQNLSTDFNLSFITSQTAGSVPHTVIFDNQSENLADYNFTWDFGDGTVIEDNSSFVTHTYTTEGLWTVTLTAEDLILGCEEQFTQTDYIYTTGGTDPCSTNPMVLTTNTTNPSGCGVEDGTATVNVTGGTSPFSYSWSNGETSTDIDGLSPGDYTLTVTDANGCTSSDLATINSFNSSITLEFYADQVSGEIPHSVTFTNSSPNLDNFNFTWNFGDGTSQENNGSTVTHTYTEVGQWTVTLTASELATGCEDELVVFNYITTLEAGDPCSTNPMVLTVNTTDPSDCTTDNGAADISVSGGTSPYTYIWSTGETSSNIDGLSSGDYSVTVTDSQGCVVSEDVTIASPNTILLSITTLDPEDCAITAIANVVGGSGNYTYLWSNGATSPIASNLNQGDYNVVVTDENNCSATSSITIDLINAPVVILTGSNPTTCGGEDGSLAVNVTGGTSPYSYLWSNDETTMSLSNLIEGDYYVEVTDANGCEVEQDYYLTDPASPELDFEVTNPSNCQTEDGSIVSEVEGGSGTYNYSWDSGETTSSIADLSSGVYTLTVTDELECSITDFVIIASSDAPELVISGEDATCYGSADGMAEVTASAGVSPYTYLWSNDESTSEVSGLSAGDYFVTVTDQEDCSVTAFINIEEPEELEIDFEISDISCTDDSSGMIELEVEGGISPYTYLWSNGESTAAIDSLTQGDYTITITDANACTIDSTLTIVGSGSGPQTGSIIGSDQVVTLITEQYSVSQNLGSTYYWSVAGGNVLTGQGSNVVTVQWGNAGIGQINVIETDGYGCVGNAVTLNVIINTPPPPAGILVNSSNTQIKVYPNPTNGDFTINLKGYKGKFEAELLDVMGRSIIKSNNKNMTLNSYPDGLYFLRVYFDGKVQDIRVVKN